MKFLPLLPLLLASSTLSAQSITETQRLYLSGHGCDDPVEWDFKCTDGRRAGEWSKIAVPSCWELQGFGTYQYGMAFYGKAHPEGIASEQGIYKTEFSLPKEWQGMQILIVFEASMTDTKARINGRDCKIPNQGGEAYKVHQGGFYRFMYDVSDRVNFGKKNVLEVTVSKESDNDGVNLSERRADYWNFGGIWRPVFVMAKPAIGFRQFAIDANMNGAIHVDCDMNSAVPKGSSILAVVTDARGKKVGQMERKLMASTDHTSLDMQVNNPALWTAETPNLYHLQLTLTDASGRTLHREQSRFGFRTIETRASDGLYINGQKVNVRGVNRHSFRPETGRTLSYAKNLEDVEVIKSMNMNAVRLSHYPADPEFYDICDSLGLYVMSELTGWHGHHETAVGQRLVREMVERDVNHPSIIWWSNGNEGGWNTELDGEFHKYDPQKRPVLHPQGNFSGYETMHYRSYGESQEYMRKPEIFMPTEFLHALYDGGAGAGLYDYWQMMYEHPRCVGGFIWDFADEAVLRTDQGGKLDCQGNWAADGIVGPHFEKEGSYYTVREVWSPVYIEKQPVTSQFTGRVKVENRYDFTNLDQVTFTYKYVKEPALGAKSAQEQVLMSGTLPRLKAAPRTTSELQIPFDLSRCQGATLVLTATDAKGYEIFSWSMPYEDQVPAITASASKGQVPTYQMSEGQSLIVKAGNRTYTFSDKSGLLQQVQVGGKSFSFGNGPRFVGVRRADRSLDQFYNHDDKDSRAKERTYTLFADKGRFAGFQIHEVDDAEWGRVLQVKAVYQVGCMDTAQWTFLSSGDAILDYTYNFSGVVDEMGIAFDYPESKVQSKRWLGVGPYRVWQNRMHGPQFGLYANDYNDPIPGESFEYPEFKGYFADVAWMELQTAEGKITMGGVGQRLPFVGVYQPRDGRDRLLYTLPETGISVLDVIPSVRNKVNTTDLNGPSAQPKWANGLVQHRLYLRFE